MVVAGAGGDRRELKLEEEWSPPTTRGSKGRARVREGKPGGCQETGGAAPPGLRKQQRGAGEGAEGHPGGGLG